MDKAIFQQGMSYLAAAYDKELTTHRAAVYWDQLGSLDGDAFCTACKSVVGADDRFPSVARLREFYQAVLHTRRARVVSLPREESTDSVLREHARMAGIPEQEYLQRFRKEP